jgi:hypothetical protein
MDVSKFIDFIKSYNKPIYLLGMGIILYFVPKVVSLESSVSTVKVIGIIFFVIGIIGILEWGFGKINQLIKNARMKNKYLTMLRTLNTDEKQVLKRQVENNERTFYLKYSDYKDFGRGLDNYEGYMKEWGVCSGLIHKGILAGKSVTEVTAFTIIDVAWDLLVNKNKKIFDKVQ